MENEFRREVFVLKPTSKEEKEKAKLRVAESPLKSEPLMFS